MGIRPANPRPGATTIRSAELERLEVCKDYAAGSQAPALTDFTAVVTGSTSASFGFSLASGECQEIWVSGGTQTDNVTVTETVPTGFDATSTVQVISLAGLQAPVAGQGNAASATIGGPGIPGALMVFTNTPTPPPPPPPVGEGRMTGGGFSVDAGFRVTGGFTIHCDITLSNNIEINWQGNKWHLTKPITSAICLDDPNVDHGPPVAPFDTFIGEGLGKLNGVEGSLIRFTFVDGGEPGRSDVATIQIFPPGGGAPVLDFGPLTVRTGNLQAHYDQPHGSKAPKN
jgi:hypothetical protein